MSLRERAVKGGAFLIGRQLVGMVLAVGGTLVVTRIIGPSQYGLFAAAVGIATFLSIFGSFGLDVYLLRKTEEPSKCEFDQIFTLLIVIGVMLCVGVMAASSTISEYMKMPQESPILFVMALCIPLNLLAVPAIVRLDRDLDFKKVAINELGSQLCYYATSIALAVAGFGAWAAVFGYLARQGSLLGFSYWTSGIRPEPHWNPRLIRSILKYGMAYSSSTWVWQLRNLVNPLIVGRFAGAEAVGYIAVAIRIAGVSGFATTLAWRIAMPALAKLNNEASRLRAGVTEGMRFQAIAVGVPLASFALVARYLIPLGFGHDWSQASKVFPFIAISLLSNAMINMHASALYMLGENKEMAFFHAVHIVPFVGSAALLVPRFGILGYGWAEIVALPAYFVVHHLLAKAIGSPSYSAPAVWYVASVGAIVLGAVGGFALYAGIIVLAAPLFFRKERAVLAGYAAMVFSRVGTPA